MRNEALIVALVLSTGCGATAHDRSALSPTSGTESPTSWVRPPGCSGTSGRDERTTRARQRVLVHLPACYDSSSSARYPVIVLIHGANADETQWPDVGVTKAADALAAAGRIAPVIIVMPDFGETSGPDEADIVAKEIVAWVDARYRTIPDAAHRAIGGISRGGGAALRATAAHPELFGVVGGHSPAIGVDAGDVVPRLRPDSGRIWLDVGRDDGLRSSTSDLASALSDDGTSVHYEENAGGHDRRYWRAHTEDYLLFYAARWR